MGGIKRGEKSSPREIASNFMYYIKGFAAFNAAFTFSFFSYTLSAKALIPLMDRQIPRRLLFSPRVSVIRRDFTGTGSENYLIREMTMRKDPGKTARLESI